MAVATTIRRDAQNSQKYGQVNIYLDNPATVVAGMPLTIGGDLVLTVVHELPNGGFQCELTGPFPRGHGRLLIHKGDAVTG
jgi:hypothetical protein